MGGQRREEDGEVDGLWLLALFWGVGGGYATVCSRPPKPKQVGIPILDTNQTTTLCKNIGIHLDMSIVS